MESEGGSRRAPPLFIDPSGRESGTETDRDKLATYYLLGFLLSGEKLSEREVGLDESCSDKLYAKKPKSFECG